MAKKKSSQSSKVDKKALDRITKRVFKCRPSKQEKNAQQEEDKKPPSKQRWLFDFSEEQCYIVATTAFHAPSGGKTELYRVQMSGRIASP